MTHDFSGLTSLAGYRFHRPVRLTDADVDSQRHLNNAAVARILNDLSRFHTLADRTPCQVQLVGAG